MAGLAETIANITQARRLGDGIVPEATGPGRLRILVPTGSNPGELGMLAYVPPGLKPGAPLVVALHGCTQNAGQYDAGTGWSMLAERHGFAVLLPEQDRGNNANACFNWFQPRDVARDSGEALSIREMIDQMVSTYRLDPRRVFITGFSAGGAMAAAMLATYPEVFAGGAIIAGLPYRSASGMHEAFEAMFHVNTASAETWGDRVRAASGHAGPYPPVQVWHGEADTTVRAGNATELVKQWANVHGVMDRPAVSDQVEGARHQAWYDKAGRLVLESFIIPGLGHGAPIDTESDHADHAVGSSDLHVLEAGISSTGCIAESWGLLAPRRALLGRMTAQAAADDDGLMGAVTRLGHAVMHSFETALRATGLMPGKPGG